MTSFESGPYVGAAFLCERTIKEVDAVFSYMRVVDIVMSPVVSPTRDEDPPPERIELTLVLILRPGKAKGSFPIELQIERPSGQQESIAAFTITFNAGSHQAVPVHVPLALQMDQSGVWWIDVLGGDRGTLMTRVPLDFQRQWIRGDLPEPGFPQ